MKLLWILCLCFVSLHQLAYADDEQSTLDTTLPTAQSTIFSLSSDGDTTTVADSADTSPSSISAFDTTDGTTVVTTDDGLTNTPQSPAEPSAEPSTEPTTEPPQVETNNTVLVDKLSNQIRQIIRHFQQPNPVGFPGQTVLPDPLPAPNVSEGLGIMGKSEFYNVTVNGLSNFTVDSINMLLDQMEVYVKIRVTDVFVLGNCTLSNFFFSTRGPFNLTLTNVTAEGVVGLIVEPDGKLRANRTMTKMSYQDLKFRLGTNKTDSWVTSIVNTAGLTVIGAIQPYIQARIDERLTNEVNRQLALSPKFPAISKMSPIDLAVLEGRQYVRSKYDPYTIQNVVNYDTEFLTLNVGPVTLHGLSKFARVGDVSLGMVNRTMVIKMRMVTGKLLGACHFLFNFGKVPQVPGRVGVAKFSVNHLQFEALVHQPMNLKEKPRLEDLQLEVGAVTMQLDGRGNFDYLVELAVRLLPDLIRHFIIDALEQPIKRKIQNDIMDQIEPEELVINNLSLFERIILEGDLTKAS